MTTPDNSNSSNAAAAPATNLFLSLEELTVLEVDRPSESEAVLKEVDTSTHNDSTFDLPEGSFVILTETELFNKQQEVVIESTGNDNDGTGRSRASSFSVASLSDLDFVLGEAPFQVKNWDGHKKYSDMILEGQLYKQKHGHPETPINNIVMLFESPSTSTEDTSFYNSKKFRFHDWPPLKSGRPKGVLGPCRYALMNGNAYPVFLREDPPVGLLDHWRKSVPGYVEPTFVKTIDRENQTVYAYLPVESIPNHVNDPGVHYHMAGKDAIHLMTQKTTHLLPDTKTRPCVVKTTHSMGSKGIFIINNDQDEQEFEQFLEVSGRPTYVITDFVDIHRNVACHFFMHPDGKRVTWYGSNENHRMPGTKHFSSDSIIFLKDQQELKELQLPFVEEVCKYCHSVGFWGFAGIDVLFDSQQNGYLVDINPRVTGSCPAIMTLQLLNAQFGFEVALFRRSGNVTFAGPAKELVELVDTYNEEHMGKSRIVLASFLEVVPGVKTKMNIGVYGNDMSECKEVLDRFAQPDFIVEV